MAEQRNRMDTKQAMFTVVAMVLMVKGADAQATSCGQAPLNTRIVGGQNAAPGSWPWQASLNNPFEFCGGTLIHSEWVLTAAHCFPSGSASDVTVYLGRQSQQLSNPNEVSRNVIQLFLNPDYNSNTNDNDAALLKLSSPVNFTNYIQPVCLAAAGSTFGNGTGVWVTGWGNIGEQVSLPSPQTLQEVEILVVANDECSSLYSSVQTITDNMICAGILQGGKDSCQGDSGGPLVFNQGSMWIQIGIVSFGEGCAQVNFPGVYSRVSQFQNWISTTLSSDQAAFVSVSSGWGRTGAYEFLSLFLPFCLFFLLFPV